MSARRLARAALLGACLAMACSNAPAPDNGLPEPERVAALRDLPAAWIPRTQRANLYDGARVYVRNRARDASGPSTRANTRPVLVVLGNRSGSRGPDGDRDGLSDEAERAIGTDPAAFDTDGDGVPDAFESANGTDPNAAGSEDPDDDDVPDWLDDDAVTMARVRGRAVAVPAASGVNGDRKELAE